MGSNNHSVSVIFRTVCCLSALHPFLAGCTPANFLLQHAVSAKLIDAPRLAVLPTHRANKLLIESKHCLALNAAGQKPNQSSLDRFF